MLTRSIVLEQYHSCKAPGFLRSYIINLFVFFLRVYEEVDDFEDSDVTWALESLLHAMTSLKFDCKTDEVCAKWYRYVAICTGYATLSLSFISSNAVVLFFFMHLGITAARMVSW